MKSDLTNANWRKSSYSSGDGGNCVEVADGFATVPVRDSKQADGPVMLFSGTGWAAFVNAVKSGALNR